MRVLLVLVLLLCGCDVRQRLDIASAKAVKEIQDTLNPALDLLQQLATTDAKLAQVLVEEFPDNLVFQEIAKAHERTAQQAADLARVKLDPYASLGEFGTLLKRINWLFSDEGIKWMLGIVMAAMGVGGGGKILQLAGKVKRAHKTDPNAPLD